MSFMFVLQILKGIIGKWWILKDLLLSETVCVCVVCTSSEKGCKDVQKPNPVAINLNNILTSIKYALGIVSSNDQYFKLFFCQRVEAKMLLLMHTKVFSFHLLFNFF